MSSGGISSSEGEAWDMSPAGTAELKAKMTPAPRLVTMFAPIVRERDTGSFDIRTLQPTLAAAKHVLEREVAYGTLAWDDEFGGSISNRYSKLVYEVRPVQARVGGNA